jgi:hypothetical protein
MNHKTPTQCLNEVLLNAAIRIEMRQQHRAIEEQFDKHAKEIARRNDELVRAG